MSKSKLGQRTLDQVNEDRIDEIIDLRVKVIDQKEALRLSGILSNAAHSLDKATLYSLPKYLENLKKAREEYDNYIIDLTIKNT